MHKKKIPRLIFMFSRTKSVVQASQHYGRIVYQNLFTKHLMLTNCSISSGQMGVADVVQQIFNGDVSRKGWDWKRTVRMATVGLIIGLPLHYFYRVLDSRKFRGSAKEIALKKLFWDTSFIPVFSCSVFTIAGLLEGNSLKGSVQEYRQKMWHIWAVDFTIWPPAQLINFYFLPNRFRMVYMNTVALIYNCLVSYIKHNDVTATGDQQKLIA